MGDKGKKIYDNYRPPQDLNGRLVRVFKAWSLMRFNVSTIHVNKSSGVYIVKCYQLKANYLRSSELCISETLKGLIIDHWCWQGIELLINDKELCCVHMRMMCAKHSIPLTINA